MVNFDFQNDDLKLIRPILACEHMQVASLEQYARAGDAMLGDATNHGSMA
jgi:hypothetical protein